MIFIQARMSSARFPGKILAPINGKPMLEGIVENCQQVVSKENVIVLTSYDPTDDPVECYMKHIGVNVIRGSLNNVFSRFSLAVNTYNPNWFIRINADSPFISHKLLGFMIEQIEDDFDLVTNVAKRSFPKGQSFEAIKAETFLSIDESQLSAHDREHVSSILYSGPYKIKNILSDNLSDGEINLCVDTIGDYNFLKNKKEEELFNFNPHKYKVETIKT